MMDHLSDYRTAPSFRAPRRSLLSARKLALMASVVAGLAAYGFGPSSGGFDIFGNAAHAQVVTPATTVAQPTGFADMVERVKPSVISVKVTMKEKISDASSENIDDEQGSPMERFFRRFGGPDGMPLTWRHFHYGTAALGRNFLRAQRAAAEAARLAAADEKDYGEWHRDITRRLEPRLPGS